MSWWFVGSTVALKGREGILAAKKGDRIGDKLDAQAAKVEQQAKEDVRGLKKSSYSNYLGMKSQSGDAIENIRIDGALNRESAKAETGGSGVVSGEGTAVDVQMALVNNARLDEANVRAVMDINIERNKYETNLESERITREAKAQAEAIRDGASDARQAGRDAKLEAGISAVTSVVTAGFGSGDFQKWFSGASAVAGQVKGGRGEHTASSDTRGQESKPHSYIGRSGGHFDNTPKSPDAYSPSRFTKLGQMTNDQLRQKAKASGAFMGPANMSQQEKWAPIVRGHSQRQSNKAMGILNKSGGYQYKRPPGLLPPQLMRKSGGSVWKPKARYTNPFKASWSKSGERFVRP
tara:strand:+ start:17418 stop:18467 length:1050 start_codon:yes stop_codon:yes gene_type:complete